MLLVFGLVYCNAETLRREAGCTTDGETRRFARQITRSEFLTGKGSASRGTWSRVRTADKTNEKEPFPVEGKNRKSSATNTHFPFLTNSNSSLANRLLNELQVSVSSDCEHFYTAGIVFKPFSAL